MYCWITSRIVGRDLVDVFCYILLLKPLCYFALLKLCDVILFVLNSCVLKIHLNEVFVFSILSCCCCSLLIILCCGHSFMIDETLGYLELTKHIMHSFTGLSVQISHTGSAFS